MWLGGFASNLFMTDEQKAKYPGITVLGKKFANFQNSPYRGEWDQKLPVTAGEIRAALLEVSALITQCQSSEPSATTSNKK